MFLPSGDHSSPPASVAIEVSLMHSGHGSCRAVEVRDPDLRATFFIRDECEALAIRRPARTIAILIGDERSRSDSVQLRRGHDPDMRSLLVSREIDIDRR